MVLRKVILLRKVKKVIGLKGYNPLSHNLITCGTAAYKKESPCSLRHKGMLSFKLRAESP